MNFEEIIAAFMPETANEKGEFGFVYMFFETKADKIPVYVGSTKNIYNRLGNHFQHKHSAHNGKLNEEAYKSIGFIKAAYVGDLYTARSIEMDLIQKFKPRYNTIIQGSAKGDEAKRLVWAGWTKQEFINDKTVVYRCFSEIIKRLKNDKIHAEETVKAYELSWQRKGA